MPNEEEIDDDEEKVIDEEEERDKKIYEWINNRNNTRQIKKITMSCEIFALPFLSFLLKDNNLQTKWPKSLHL